MNARLSYSACYSRYYLLLTFRRFLAQLKKIPAPPALNEKIRINVARSIRLGRLAKSSAMHR